MMETGIARKQELKVGSPTLQELRKTNNDHEKQSLYERISITSYRHFPQRITGTQKGKTCMPYR